MSEARILVLTPEQIAQIQREGVAAYPHECCGILYGRERLEEGATWRVVEELEAVENAFVAGERYHRFSIAPGALIAAEKKAAAGGRLVLGFYHSHPDHPARPSEYDREHAWPFYSYAIVAIARGRAGELTSWELDQETEQFESEIIRTQDAPRRIPHS